MRHSLGSSSSTRTGKRGVPSSAQRSVALGRGDGGTFGQQSLTFHYTIGNERLRANVPPVGLPVALDRRVAPPAMTAADPESRTVLIADDDPGMRRLVRAVLGDDRYQLLEAANGQEAWQLISLHHPPVVILDWEMPFHTGIELAAVIKGDPLLHGTHLVMVTSRSATRDLEDLDEAGVDVYLTKPFATAALLAAVERAFGVP